MTVIFRKETPYGFLEAADIGEKRFLLVEGEMESCVSLPSLEPVLFPYMERFSYARANNPEIHTVLLLGGGACSYPRWFLEHQEGTIDVVEISAEILDVSRRYFGLKEAEKDPRLHLFNEDADSFLEHTRKKYDLILNDAFIGRNETARELHSTELIHAHLKEGGIYLMNTLGSLKGWNHRAVKKRRKILESCFRNTSVIVCEEDLPLRQKQNLLMAASDAPLL